MMTQEKKKGQIRRTLDELKRDPATSMMLLVKTGILRANLCRYLAGLEKQGRITVVKEETCWITGHKAKYYSADPELIPKAGQAELFKRRGARV